MTAQELNSKLEAMQVREALADEAEGFIPLDTADYSEVGRALGEQGRVEVRRALAWLCLMKQTPRRGRGPWSPGAEIQGYLRAVESCP